MKLECDDIRLCSFEQNVLTGSEIRQLPGQNEATMVQFTGNSRLPQHEQCLQDATLSHSVQAAKKGQRGTGQIQAVKTLEIREFDFPKH